MLTTAILVLLVLIPIGDLAAIAFFFHLFLHSKKKGVLPEAHVARSVKRRPRLWGGPAMLGGRSWLIGLMTLAWGTITVVFVLIGVEAGSRLIGRPPVPLLGALPTALGIIAVGTIPITFALVFALTRRKRGGAPPPFGESD